MLHKPLPRPADPAPPIPLQQPFVTGREAAYVQDVAASGRIGSDGPYARACVALLKERFGYGDVFLTPSCTDGLELAAMALGLGPGDEVILPSFTFTATATAILRTGARPVFVDVTADTLTLDTGKVEAAIGPRTRAIFPVHYTGVAPDMDALLTIASRHGLRIVEDAAQGIDAFDRGRPLGGIGDLGALSFHATKNIACGEGGAICVNRPDLLDRVQMIREKGTNRAQFLRGQVDKYTWVENGSSMFLNELAAAFLLAQLEAMDEIGRRRARLYQAYLDALRPLAARGALTLPVVPERSRTNHHLFHMLLPDEATRNDLMACLNADGIGAAFHFVPLHASPMGQRLGYAEGELPVTEDAARRLLRLPLFTGMTPDQQERVIEAVHAYFR